MAKNENKKNETPDDGGEAKVKTQTRSQARRIAATQAGEGTPSTTEAPKTEEAKGTDEVVVNKADLKTMMERIGKLEKDNERLISVADKGRMFALTEKERAENKNLKMVAINRFGEGNKIVIAWKTKDNVSYVDGNRTVRSHSMIIFFEDGTSETMPSEVFWRNKDKKLVVPVVAETKVPAEEVGGKESVIFKLKLEGGKTIEIDKKYIN